MKYKIDFYCDDDLRDSHTIEAHDEVRALILALGQVDSHDDRWVDGGSAYDSVKHKYWIKITAYQPEEIANDNY